MSKRKHADKRDLHDGQLREADQWITMSEKVCKERLIHEGMLTMPDDQKTRVL